MYKNKKLLGIILSTLVLFGATSHGGHDVFATDSNDVYTEVRENIDSTQKLTKIETVNALSSSVSFDSELSSSVVDKEVKNKDKEITYDKSSSKIINLNGDSANFTGTGIKVEGSNITITEAGTYVLSGSLKDGQIIVEATKDDDVRLVLENVNIHCEKSAAIYVKNADKLIITLPSGTTNTLSGGAAYENIDDNNIDGVIFSKDDLTVNGEGTLNINANYKHGIVSKNDLNILGGIYNINSVSQALSGKDAVKIYGGTFNVESKGKGIKSENTEEPEKGNIYVAGGKFNLNTVDDSFHSSGSIVLDGGEFNIKTEDDAIHADKDVVVNNGKINILQSYEGIEGYKVVVNGGDISINVSDDAINATNPNSTTSTENVNQEVDINTNITQESFKNFGQANITSQPMNPAQKVPFNFTEGTILSMMNGGGRGFNNDTINDVNAYIKITGGNLVITSGGDGLDSNGSILVNGGDTFISSLVNTQDTSVDYNGTLQIDGGTLIAVGGNGMMNHFSGQGSEQRSIFYTVSSQQGKGSNIKVTDSSGKEIVSWEPPMEYTTVIISSPDLKENQSYKIQVGTESYDLTLKDMVTRNGISMSMGGGRGQRRSFNSNFNKTQSDFTTSSGSL